MSNYVVLNVNYFHTKRHTSYLEMSINYLLDLLFCRSTIATLDTTWQMFLERTRHTIQHGSK